MSTIGGRRHLIDIRARVRTTVDGNTSETWPVTSRRGQRWADKRIVSAREVRAGASIEGSAETLFDLAYETVAAAIAPTDRIYHGADEYDVRAAYDPDGLRRAIIVLATRRDIQ